MKRLLSNSRCRSVYDGTCFTVLCRARRFSELKVLKAVFIHKYNPKQCIQKDDVRIHHYLLYNTRVQNDDWWLGFQIVFRDLCGGSLSVVPKLAILIDVLTNTTDIHSLVYFHSDHDFSIIVFQ